VHALQGFQSLDPWLAATVERAAADASTNETLQVSISI
jgi:hypothetical protein